MFQPKLQHSGVNICTYAFLKYLVSLTARSVNGIDFAATNACLFFKVTFRFTVRSNYTITLSPCKEDDVLVNHDLVAIFLKFVFDFETLLCSSNCSKQ